MTALNSWTIQKQPGLAGAACRLCALLQSGALAELLLRVDLLVEYRHRLCPTSGECQASKRLHSGTVQVRGEGVRLADHVSGDRALQAILTELLEHHTAKQRVIQRRFAQPDEATPMCALESFWSSAVISSSQAGLASRQERRDQYRSGRLQFVDGSAVATSPRVPMPADRH
jgi:hypothetical protein